MILDGVVAPEDALGPDSAIDAEIALRNVLQRCQRDEACQRKFGDPEATYRAVRAALESQALCPSSSPIPRRASRASWTSVRCISAWCCGSRRIRREQAALLPLTLDLAKKGNYAPIAGQFLMTVRELGDVLAYGMHNAVVCTEDVPFYTPEQDRSREGTKPPSSGRSQVEALQSLCKDWPRGPIDADLHAPLKSDVPVLLLSGGNDPVTPAANGEPCARRSRRTAGI